MIVRLDDFPQGAAPLPGHLERMGPVLHEMEVRGIPYALGVIPALVTDADLRFLSTLKHCMVALHGYDHGLQAFAETGCRSEFRGKSASDIEKLLRKGLKRLRGFQVTVYIPTFNVLTKPLSRAVQAIPTIEYMATGPRNFDCDFGRLTRWTPKAEFYGKSNFILPSMDTFTPDDHIALHVTWEAVERERLGVRWGLPLVLDQIERILP